MTPIPFVGGPYCGESYPHYDRPETAPPYLVRPYRHGDHTRLYRYELAAYPLTPQTGPAALALRRYEFSGEQVRS